MMRSRATTVRKTTAGRRGLEGAVEGAVEGTVEGALEGALEGAVG